MSEIRAGHWHTLESLVQDLQRYIICHNNAAGRTKATLKMQHISNFFLSVKPPFTWRQDS